MCPVKVERWLEYIDTREREYIRFCAVPKTKSKHWDAIETLLLLDIVEEHIDGPLDGDVVWTEVLEDFALLNFGEQKHHEKKNDTDTAEQLMRSLYAVFDVLMKEGHGLELIREYTMPELIAYQKAVCDRYEKANDAVGKGNKKNVSPDNMFAGLSR